MADLLDHYLRLPLSVLWTIQRRMFCIYRINVEIKYEGDCEKNNVDN